MLGHRHCRLALAVLFVALLSVAVSPSVRAADVKCEPGKLAQKYPSLAGRTIKLAVTVDTKPLGWRDPNNFDHIMGYSPDQAAEVFKCLGLPTSYLIAPFSGALAALNSGQVDVLWGSLFYTPERAKTVDLIIYVLGASAGVVHHGNPKNIHGLADLCGLRAASVIGGIEAVKLRDTSNACVAEHKPAIDITTAPDRPSALRLLDSDRADLYLGIGMKQAYDTTLYDIPFVYANDLKTGIGLQKGNKELENAIFEALSVLHATGQDKALLAKYDIDPNLALAPQILTE
jgi:polar amino acid transport system substrate-binding protein